MRAAFVVLCGVGSMHTLDECCCVLHMFVLGAKNKIMMLLITMVSIMAYTMACDTVLKLQHACEGIVQERMNTLMKTIGSVPHVRSFLAFPHSQNLVMFRCPLICRMACLLRRADS